MAECRWNLPWKKKVCSRDPEEVQVMDCMTTPMESNMKLLSDASLESVDATMYRQMIGSLMYLTNMRPNIFFKHLEPVLDRSEECSLDSYKAYSEVPEGYS